MPFTATLVMPMRILERCVNGCEEWGMPEISGTLFLIICVTLYIAAGTK